jgi:phosphate transport system protein
MTEHFFRDLKKMKIRALDLGSKVEAMLRDAMQAADERNIELALSVIKRDDLIDQEEIAIEEECLKMMALHQPVAMDLRQLIAMIKMNNDLERIADMACNIARAVSHLKKDNLAGDVTVQFHAMAEKVYAMFVQSMEAVLDLDADLALKICADDNEVDALHEEFYELVKLEMKSNVENVNIMLRYLNISRNLERIGDHITNIAEDVLYMVKGHIVRHDPKLRVKS